MLRVVRAYLHLGTTVTTNSSLSPEIAGRAGAGNAAFATLSRQVFARKDLGVQAKLRAVGAFVNSRLFYNGGPWHQAKTTALLEKTRRHVVCKILGRNVDPRMVDRDLYAEAGLLPIADLLHRRRLLYLRRVVCNGPALLHSLIHLAGGGDGSWAKLLTMDLQNLYVFDDSLAGLPDPFFRHTVLAVVHPV